MNLHQVNSLDQATFVSIFGGVYEHTPWIAETAWLRAPFSDMDTLLTAFQETLREASEDRRLTLIRAHPELGYRAGIDPSLSRHSTAEQADAGLDRLTPDEYACFQALNDAYLAKFDMPFVICVRQARHKAAGEATKTIIIKAMEERLAHDLGRERAEALRQIDAIAAFRIRDIVTS